MRLTATWAWISMGLLAVACSDEEPDPVVNEDIAWMVGCVRGTMCTADLQPHSQQSDTETPFEVSCAKNGSFLNITVRDPGVSTEEAGLTGKDARFGSELNIFNIDRNAGTCNVDVREMTPVDIKPVAYRAACGSGCTLNVLTPRDEWEFVAELSCDALRPGGNTVENNPSFTLSHAADKTRAVQISVANCD